MIAIYAHSSLQSNPVALCNMGYLYETGAIREDIERACKYYEQVDTDYGKIHLLKAYIMTGDTNKIEDIWSLMHTLWNTQPSVQDYFMFCNYDCSADEYWANNPEETSVKLDYQKCRQWESIYCYYEGSGAPANNSYTRWIGVGVDYVENHTVLRFQKCTLRYINILDAGFVYLESL